MKIVPDFHSDQLKQDLLAGDRKSILSILYFLLTQKSALKKRAYLAPYLTPVDVASEFQHDQTIQELLQRYAGMQEEFKSTHIQYDQLKQQQTTVDMI